MMSSGIEGLRGLYERARMMPITSQFDMDYALALLHVDSESRTMSAPRPTTLEHLHMYMVHLCQVLPETLAVLANPANWRAERLLNPETMTLRRPRIYLQASIKERRCLYISWGLVPTVPYEYGKGTPKNLQEASDFTHIDATWTRGRAPGYTIVRLTAEEYPSLPYSVRAVCPELAEEDAAQRAAFWAFLKAMVDSLRKVLDVEIEDWIEYDERGFLQTVSTTDRVKRLGREQHQVSVNVLARLTQEYESTLQRAGVTGEELERVVSAATETDRRLADVFAEVTGRKVHATQLKACARAYEPIPHVRELEAYCRQVALEAEAEQ